MNTNFKKIGELLYLRRKSKGLTQDEVGAMIGVQKAMVSKVENGLCMNFNTISRIADALEVEPIVELKPMKKADKNVIDYIMTAIIEFSKRHRLTIREASNYLNRFKGIDFLTEFYDVEHTLSFNDCVDDLTVVCQNNGGAIR
jgi:transcriptional regulator with XRE-family HTH domain